RAVGLALLFGVWVLLTVDQRLDKVLSASMRLDAQCEGEVVGLPVEHSARVTFAFKVHRCLSDAIVPRGTSVRVAWYRSDQTPLPGETWWFSLRLKAPGGRLNLLGFDYQTWLFVSGYGATATVRSTPQPKRLDPAKPSLSLFRWRVRDTLREQVSDLRHGGLIEALVVGSRDRMDPAQATLLAASGTAHLVAISGLHIGMVAGVAFFLASLLWAGVLRLGVGVWVPRAVFSATLALLCAGVYAALAGFALPTTRALIMLATAYLLLIARKSNLLWLSVKAALAIILLCWPLSLIQPGFWLSFSAVAAIALGLRARRHWSGPRQSAWVNLATGLVMAPVTVLVFAEVHWVSPLANAVLVPVFGLLVVPVALSAAVLMPVLPHASAALFTGIDLVLGVLMAVLDVLLGLVPLGMPGVQTVASLLSLGLASTMLLLPRLWPMASALALATWVATFAMAPARPAHGQLRVTVLDVGHGLAAVLETRHKTLVYDTGPRVGRFDAGAQLVVPTVRAGGRTQIDALVVSHADSDHAGGLRGILDTLPVNRVLRPEDRSCRAGVSWVWDAVRFELLHPSATDRGGENDLSCVLRVSVQGGQSLLLLGDVERRGERALLRRQLAPATVMTVPHHGSATSSSEALLRAVQPALAINSHAALGRFNLPHPRVADRYRALSIPVVSTANRGAIRFELPLDGPPLESIEFADRARRRMWHRSHRASSHGTE
ncbi:MAG: DNA internalization-related competence protein ComEC/Rec2, partial [Pseudomonadota bacterium]